MLSIYQPEVVRYFFTRSRPNREFVISFDLDVIKIYEDYDRCHRIAFSQENVTRERQEKEKRIWELAQISTPPDQYHPPAPFRHLCNLLQIHQGDIDYALSKLLPGQSITETQRRRARCALTWLDRYAPTDFCFRLQTPDAPWPILDEEQKDVLESLLYRLEALEVEEPKADWYKSTFKAISEDMNVPTKNIYQALYALLIDKQQGPRLADFLSQIGSSYLLERLKR